MFDPRFDVDTLREQVEELEAETKYLLSKNDELEEEIKYLLSKNDKLEARVDYLETQLEESVWGGLKA